MIAMLMALLLIGGQRGEAYAEPPELMGAAVKLPPVSDAALLALVKAPFDPNGDDRKWPRAIGLHKGVAVVAIYRCSDLCPDYTKRIIRYNVLAGPDCDRVGGVSKSIIVPRGIAAMPVRYCLPAVTAPFQK